MDTRENRKQIREFNTGANRNVSEGKIDPSAAQCPRCFQLYCEYIKKNRKLVNGVVRSDDNWQKGFPPKETIKSLRRHTLDTELHLHGDGQHAEETYDNALGGVIFNGFSLWHEHHKNDKTNL